MYAAYYSIKKLEHLLSDIPFIWYTDHKNNTLTRSTGSDKTLRWDLYLQGFRYTKKYIKGSENEISDSLSRLCSISDPNEYIHPTYERENQGEYINLLEDTSYCDEELALVAEPQQLSTTVYETISKVHNSVIGHLGVERTLQKLNRLKKTWPCMKADIITFIKSCPLCQKMSRIKVPIHTTHFTTASYGLMKKLSMDCIGPLKLTDDGYSNILVIIDNFSRYTVLYPLKEKSGPEIAQCLLTHIGTYGCPNIIQMDNGTEFVNAVVTEVLKLLGTHSATILAYSKDENAIVERCNKEVMRHLRALVYEINKRSAWRIYLPLAQRIINSEISSVTGVSPNDLLYGGKIDLDGNLLTKSIPQSTDVHIASWSSDMIAAQDKLISISQMRQRIKDEKHLSVQKSQVTQFPPNTFVLVQYPQTAMGNKAPSKLHTHWKGPMRVISNNGSEYKLHDLVQNKDITVHISRLKPFEHDSHRHDPLAIAAKDYEEEPVEAILAHQGNPKRKTSMDFLVRWLGYDESEDLWLPWSALQNNAALHKYLKANNMEKLIPKS